MNRCIDIANVNNIIAPALQGMDAHQQAVIDQTIADIGAYVSKPQWQAP